MPISKILTFAALPFMALSSSEYSPKVAIIGAGLAGLTTAWRLQQQGVDVELYEARTRVGGRVFSVRINDQVGELGAQNLCDGGKAENIFRLIEEVGLEIQSVHLPINYSWFSGEKLIHASALFPHRDPAVLQQQLAASSEQSGTMFEVLNTLFDVNDPAFRCLSVRLAAYEGAPPEHLSSSYTNTLHHMMRGGTCEAHQENTFHLASIVGGNSLLPEKLAKDLGDRLHLNSPLVSVTKSSDAAYTLLFKDGRRERADLLVLAIPCSVYSDIHFGETVIPPEKLSAIRSIQYGTNAKILIPFSEPPRQRMALLNERIVAFFDAIHHLLTCYYTGESSRFSAETVNDALQKERPMLEIGHLNPPLAPPVMARDEIFGHYHCPVAHSWPNDPYAKGTWHYVSPGQERLLGTLDTVAGETVKTLFAPIDGTLYFAGEHTSILLDVPATMEAACESGERTSRMIIGRLRLP